MRKIFQAIGAALNALVNLIWKSNPIQQLQYQVDIQTTKLVEYRKGIETSRAHIERLQRQVNAGRKTVADQTSAIKSYLSAGKRETAAQMALDLKEQQNQLGENEGQLKTQEATYQNYLMKFQEAGRMVEQNRREAMRLKAELQTSRAEAEIADFQQTLGTLDITTDFGQLTDSIHEEIDKNRAKVRVANDLSGQGLEEIKERQAVREHQAEEVLKQFEIEMGLAIPAPAESVEKQIGPVEEITTK